MKRRYQKTFLIVSLWLAVLSSNAFALTEFGKKLVKWETESPSLFRPSSEPFKIKHFEIPVSAIHANIATFIDDEVKGALVFQKNGQAYVRWLIHPDDTAFANQVQKWLEQKGLDATRHQYFTAYRTASRSMIIEDPHSGAEFSAKVSTNVVNGVQQNKKESFDDGHGARVVGDHADKVKNHTELKTAVIMQEPAHFGIKDLDQSMTIRAIDGMKRTGRYYLPGTAAINGKIGKEIAALNGSNDPAAFWKKHFMEAAGRAQGEMLATMGLFPQSNHSQNLLIELDHQFRPTGRVVIRDLTDMYLFEPYFKATGQEDVLQHWEAEYRKGGDGKLELREWLAWQDSSKEWPKAIDYKEWSAAFFDGLEDGFKQATGKKDFNLHISHTQLGTWSGDQGRKTYNIKANDWQDYLKSSGCYVGKPHCPAQMPVTENMSCTTKAAHAVQKWFWW